MSRGVWAGLGLLLGGGEGASDHGQRKGKHPFFSFEPFAVVPFSLVAPLPPSPVTAKFRVHDQVKKVLFTFFRQTGKKPDGFKSKRRKTSAAGFPNICGKWRKALPGYDCSLDRNEKRNKRGGKNQIPPPKVFCKVFFIPFLCFPVPPAYAVLCALYCGVAFLVSASSSSFGGRRRRRIRPRHKRISQRREETLTRHHLSFPPTRKVHLYTAHILRRMWLRQDASSSFLLAPWGEGGRGFSYGDEIAALAAGGGGGGGGGAKREGKRERGLLPPPSSSSVRARRDSRWRDAPTRQGGSYYMLQQ